MSICDEWTVASNLPVEFKVKIVNNILDPTSSHLLEYGDRNPGARRLILVDSCAFLGRESQIRSYFDHHEILTKIVSIDVSEEKKNLDNLMFILSAMENFGILRRSEPLICIGGGVLLDMAGLAANLYRRGVPYIKVPTTLLAIVDASVGVKTSINNFSRRNRLGSYYPPVASYLDKTFLTTLDDKEIISAMGEILKMAVIKNHELFTVLENNIEEILGQKFLVDGASDKIISICIDDMIKELQPNLWEKNLRRIVDFGHSFSPLLEMRSLADKNVNSMTHGGAVALDVIFSSCLSSHRNLLGRDQVIRIINLAKKMKLDTFHEYFTNELMLWEALNDTKKHRNGSQNLPTPVRIGESIFLNDVTFQDVKSTIKLYNSITR